MSVSTEPKRPRGIVLTAYYVFLAAVLSMTVEFGARFFETFGPRTFVFKKFDETLGLSLIPGSLGVHRSCFDGYVSINQYGLRDVPRDLEKPRGTYRIGVFGDSVIEGLHVQPNQVATRRLEARLNNGPCLGRCEVLNFGIGGFGTLQEFLRYQRDGRPFDLDLVLLVFVGNDLENNLPGGEYDGNLFSAPYLELNENGTAVIHLPDKPPLYRPLFLLNSKSAAFRFAYKFYYHHLYWQILHHQKSVPLRPGFPVRLEFLAPDSPVSQRAWSVTERVLSDFAEAVRADGGEMMLAYSGYDIRDPSPDLLRITKEFEKSTGYSVDLTLASKRLEAWAKASTVEAHQLDPEIEAYKEREGLDTSGLGYSCDGHFNPEGHAVLSNILLGMVRSRVSAAVATKDEGPQSPPEQEARQ